MKGKLWHNGVWKGEDEAVFTALDRVRLGDGVFDTMLAVGGRLVHPGKHFARLKENAAVLGMRVEFGFEEAALALTGGPARPEEEGERYAINTVISRGPAARGLMPPKHPDLQIVMRASLVPTAEPAPIHAIIAQSVRRNEGSPLSRIKSLGYGDSILALNEAVKAGANEAILLNNAGFVTCASSSNIFAVINGEIFTPPLQDGVLNGVARQVFMERYPVRALSLRPEDLLAAESLFLTNSVGGARAIERLEDKTCIPALPSGIDKDFALH
jgi:branched-chain amino acid aminotransferase